VLHDSFLEYNGVKEPLMSTEELLQVAKEAPQQIRLNPTNDN